MRNDECGYNVKICDGMAGPERGQAMARLVFVSFYLNHGSEQPTLYLLHVYTYVFTSRDGLVEAYMCIHTAYMCTAPLPIGIAWPCSAALAIGSRPALARTHGRPPVGGAQEHRLEGERGATLRLTLFPDERRPFFSRGAARSVASGRPSGRSTNFS